MANTYELIASVTLSSSQTSIDFTSIPSTYTDLKLVGSIRSDRAASVDDQMLIKPNGSSTGLTYIHVRGNGSTATSGNVNRTYVNAASSTASTFSNFEIYFPNYAGSSNKSFSYDGVVENNATEAYDSLQAQLWSNTAAITSISLTPVSGTNWVQYSNAYLYGIKNS